mmetsp:Transcript_7670/g.22661  ORF Transcript_7670/g.22661 Transcript_7670/m.22661 type:complete len:216 (-) Transcript_7670:44-691(-)
MSSSCTVSAFARSPAAYASVMSSSCTVSAFGGAASRRPSSLCTLPSAAARCVDESLHSRSPSARRSFCMLLAEVAGSGTPGKAGGLPLGRLTTSKAVGLPLGRLSTVSGALGGFGEGADLGPPSGRPPTGVCSRRRAGPANLRSPARPAPRRLPCRETGDCSLSQGWSGFSAALSWCCRPSFGSTRPSRGAFGSISSTGSREARGENAVAWITSL